MVVLGGGAVSDERGTPLGYTPQGRRWSPDSRTVDFKTVFCAMPLPGFDMKSELSSNLSDNEFTAKNP